MQQPGSERMKDDTRLPMPPDEVEALKMPESEDIGDHGADRGLPMPADTLEILTSNKGSTAQGTHSGDSSKAGSRAGQSTNIDTIIGHVVVEQGLATTEQVAQCRELLRQRKDVDPNAGSLAELLVESEFVTKHQLDRLKRQVEAERSTQQIPGYQILGKLGAGAMAAVYKAKQLSLDRLVAIKILPRKYSNNPQFIERFYAEGRAAAQLNHPNIVQAYDVGQAGEFHYFVMEYVEGATVHDYITDNKRFSEKEAIDVVINIADALAHAHDKGLIHRDVKPKNVMFTPNGVAKLADLGLARAIDDKDAALAEAGKAYGTPYYISPEQVRGEVNIGPQADIYSLGATIYHMLTGNVPFNGKNPTEVMQKHLKAPLIPPDHVNGNLSNGISEVVEMMMAKSRKLRYKNCHDLLIDLKAVRRGEQPPIAHKEVTGADLAAVAAVAQSQTAEVAKDKTTQPSPFDYPIVQGLIVALVVMTVLCTVFGIVAFV